MQTCFGIFLSLLGRKMRVFLLNIVCMSLKSRNFAPFLCGLVKQNERSNRKL